MDAIATWWMAVHLDSTDAAACFDLATALFVSGDARGAVEPYDRALALAPDRVR